MILRIDIHALKVQATQMTWWVKLLATYTGGTELDPWDANKGQG